jgi:Lipopolysaccharide biosynthesis protein
MKLEITASRLGIYVFNDISGIVDKYVTFFLDHFIKNLSDLVIVCIGEISAEGRKKLDTYSSSILFIQDGTLYHGYKYGMDFFGWEQLKRYDEIVLTSNSLMGPISPFVEMFKVMNKRDLDFWGITKHNDNFTDDFEYSNFGHISDYIQFDFIAFRSSFYTAFEFKAYWNTFPKNDVYKNPIQHEAYFTKHFAEKGFIWDSYIKTDDIKEVNSNLFMNCPLKIIERGSPIFNRDVFIQNYNYAINNSAGQAALELFNYLKECTDFDVDMIWENILRISDQADVVYNLHLSYILHSDFSNQKNIEKIIQTKRIALIMHIFFEDLIESMFRYATSMPKTSDIYITTDTEEKKTAIEKKFEELKCKTVEVRIIENRGRDISSLLVGARDIINQYEYVCFAHDKKSAYIRPWSLGESFASKCIQNVLFNKNFVYNVVETFENNPRLGMLSPPEPNHGPFFPTIGGEWGLNFENTVKLASQFHLSVPIKKDKPPIAPFGTMFWFRPSALRKLFDANIQYEDFPKEPNKTEGTILHAYERLYPYIVQEEGFYPGILMADKFVPIEYTNLRYFVRGYNVNLFKNGINSTFTIMNDKMNKNLDDLNNLKAITEKRLKEIQDWSDIANERLGDILNKQKVIDDLNHRIDELGNYINDLIPYTSLKNQILIRSKRLLSKLIRRMALANWRLFRR